MAHLSPDLQLTLQQSQNVILLLVCRPHTFRKYLHTWLMCCLRTAKLFCQTFSFRSCKETEFVHNDIVCWHTPQTEQKPHGFKSGNQNTTIILNYWFIKEIMSPINKSLPWTNYLKKKFLALTPHNVSHAPENLSDIRHSTNQRDDRRSQAGSKIFLRRLIYTKFPVQLVQR